MNRVEHQWKPNVQKRSCYLGIDPQEMMLKILEAREFEQGILPIRYEGIPLITGKLRSQNCLKLVQKLCARI